MSEFAALCADLGRTFTDEELAATLASLDEDGEQDDPGIGEQPVVAALLPTEG